MRARMIFGIILMVFAFAFLFGFIVFPVIPQLADAPVFDRFLGAILCSPDQILIRDQYSQSFGSETQFSMNVACRDAQGNLSDVTDKWGQVGMVGYLVPFLLGLFIFLNGSRGLLNQKKPPQLDQSIRRDLSDILPQVKASAETGDSVNLALTQLSSQLASELTPEKIDALKQRVRVIQNGSPSFTEKLKQVKQAHDSGLISDDEFERLRKSILDDMK